MGLCYSCKRDENIKILDNTPNGVPICTGEIGVFLENKEQYLFDRNSKVLKKFTGGLPVLIKKYIEFTQFELNYYKKNILYYKVILYFRPNQPMAVAIESSKEINYNWCSTHLYRLYNNKIEANDPETVWKLLSEAEKAINNNGEYIFPYIEILKPELILYYSRIWGYSLQNYNENQIAKNANEKGIY